MKNCCVLSLVAVMVAFLWAGQARATALSDFNLVVLGNVTGTSEVEGRTAVFGDIEGSSSMNFAVKEEAVASATSTAGLDQNDALIVGGQILTTNAIQVNNGNVRVGGSDAGTQVNKAEADTVTYNDGAVASVLADLKADIDNLTAMLSGLTANSSLTGDMNNLTFTTDVGLGNIALVDIDMADYEYYNPNLSLEGDADLYVFRISGEDVTIGSNWHMDALAAYQDKIIWYFEDATSLYLGGAVEGSVIATNAELTNANYIAGTVVVDTMNLTGEAHLSTLVTPPSNPVPEPGTLLLLSCGLLGLTGLKRKKQQR